MQACYSDERTLDCAELMAQYLGEDCDPERGVGRVLDFLDWGCTNGSWKLCAWQAATLYKLGDRKSRERAWALALKACDHGDGEGCSTAASVLAWWRGSDGRPSDVDLAKSLELTKRACDLGNKDGCNDYAVCLIQRNQMGDKTEARRLLESQCEAGFDRSCVALGAVEYNGELESSGPDHPERLWRTACACGELDGCFNTALRLFKKGDVGAGLAVYESACEKKHWQSCRALGKLYAEGAKVGRDLSRARQYYERTCRFNDRSACHALKQLEESFR